MELKKRLFCCTYAFSFVIAFVCLITIVSASISCYSNSDCNSGFFGNEYCENNDVYKSYLNSTCINAGTEQSYCSNSINGILLADCGVSSNGSWSNNYCKNNNVYHSRTNNILGCKLINIQKNISGCFSEFAYEEALVRQCANGCLNGVCINQSNQTIMCSSNSDCGQDSFIDSEFCSSNDLFQYYIIFICHNSGTPNSYCSNSSSMQLKADCGTNSCDGFGNKYCKQNKVYHNQTCYNRGCASDSCFSNSFVNENIILDCGSNICTNGVCINQTNQTIICSDDSDCGEDGFFGSIFCSNGNVFQNYDSYACNNPGTPQSYCSNSSAAQLKQICNYGCLNGACINQSNQTIMCSDDSDCGIDEFIGDKYCNGDSVYQDYIRFRCNNPGTASSFCFNYTQHRLLEDCYNGCDFDKCNEEDNRAFNKDCNETKLTSIFYAPDFSGFNESLKIGKNQTSNYSKTDFFNDFLLWIIILLIILIVIVLILILALRNK